MAQARLWPLLDRPSLADSELGIQESGVAMQHFSCDLCGTNLIPGSDSRFVVKMEVYAAHDAAELTEDDLDTDHLEEIGQILADEAGDDREPAPAFAKRRYDLCSSCHMKFLADPLGRETQKFDFSEN